MAARGTNKRRSVDQEERIAKVYNGRRSRSSGAAIHDSGDVVTMTELIECKTTGGPGEKKIPEPRFLKELGKVVEEARERGRVGSLALRFYLPDSYLSNRDGWVEVTVRRTPDDADLHDRLRVLEDEVEIAREDARYWEGRSVENERD